ncbi:unnamed protein product [Musa hybrid cultivar]
MATTARLSGAIAVLVVLGSLCGLSQQVVAEEVHRLDGQRSVVVSADEEKGTKIVIIPCVKNCHENGEFCYCCIAAKHPHCYQQLEQCQAYCARCDPKCPPAPPSMETRP